MAKRKTAAGGKTASGRQAEHEQEGFGRPIGLKEGQLLACSSKPWASRATVVDFIGGSGWPGLPRPHRSFVEWETSPSESAGATVFSWIGGSQVRPVRDAFPYVTASLSVDSAEVLRFPLGFPNGYQVENNGFRLSFEPRRFQSLVEESHRVWEPSGINGFYRLTVPRGHVRKGKRVRLRVDLDAAPGNCETVCYVSPRKDVLRVTLETLRSQIAQLQKDMVQLTKSHEMLYAQAHPEMFPRKLPGRPFVIHQDETLHYHPATITVMADGEAVVTAREATDHLANDGRMVMFRSRDGGASWGPREVMFSLERADHRCAPIFELPNGEWLTTDYRPGGLYGADGVVDTDHFLVPSQWAAWSTDRGRTWTISEKPLTVPGAPAPYVEVERHMIRLPSGRLLTAGIYCGGVKPDGSPDYYGVPARIAIFRSDDNGRSWEVHALLPPHPHTQGAETTLLRTKSGKIVTLSRTQISGPDWMDKGSLLQSESRDDGATWSGLRATGLSSMSSPAHLLQLQDGRILCTHASRRYPGSIYVTVSRDEADTWDTERSRIVTNDLPNSDSCYPTSGQLPDGTVLTVWYGNLFGKFYLKGLRYRPEEI
jgi:sialidase-1